VLGGDSACTLDIAYAAESGSRTTFHQGQQRVVLGADAYPGVGIAARSRMSMLACLAHALAHARRYLRGYDRPVGLIDEAETSLDASFELALNPKDRRDLVEDASDQIARWLKEEAEQ